MPKKTKKQKVKTNESRHHNQPMVHSIQNETKKDVLEASSHPVFSFQKKSPSSPVLSTHHESIEGFGYLKHDLLRTVVLALVCCGILIGCSFVLK